MDLIWRTFAEMAGPAAVSALWQGVALALGVALCLRLVPRISAADRFKVWAAAFAALAFLPFLPALLTAVPSLFFSAQSGSIAHTLPADQSLQPQPWLDLDPRWLLAIAAAWLAGSLARGVDLAMHTVRLRRLWKRAVPLDVARGGISSNMAQVCTTRDLDRPSVIGFFAPRILIPEWLMERLSDSELEQVVLHEAEHLRRHDDWINLAQKLCLMVFPLNPALAWMERRLCREREMACDEGVVRRTQAPRAYAACLASLAERRFEREHGRQPGLERRAEALSLGAWQRRPELVERVHRILRRSPGLHPAAARALVGLVGCGLVLGSVELARCPQLVAFVRQPAAEHPLAANANAMMDGTPMSRFRAIDTVAHVPSRAQLAEARLSEQRMARSKARARRLPALATEETHQVRARNIVARADVPARAHVAAAAQPQQWIVLTTWEQVETTSSAANQAAANQAAASQAAANQPNRQSADSAPQIVSQYTVTQLIFRVDPVASSRLPVPSAANTAPASRTISIIPVPAAIPIRDGWLVLQL